MKPSPDRFKTAVVAVLALWLALFVLAPNLLVLAASVLRRDEGGFVDFSLNLDNYRRLLDPLYLRVFGHSLWLAGLATLICLGLGYPFAYALARVRPGLRPLLLTLVIVPFWTNSLVRVYAIRALLAAKGVLNNALLAWGVLDEPVRLLYTRSAVLIGLVYVLLPFMVLPLYSALEKLDWRLVEAAADLGAGRLARLRHVVWPLTLPGVVAGCLLVFMSALGMFFVTDVLGGARELLLGNLLKDQFLDARDWPFGAAASVVLVVLLLLFLAAYLFSVRRYAPKGDS
ncbi:MAG: spermidine/putrescine ABC transporter permease PotB [Candidatus Methylumidiphilus sp.]